MLKSRLDHPETLVSSGYHLSCLVMSANDYDESHR